MSVGIAEVLEREREQILRIAAHHGASNVRVFGSVARGEARPASDLDLLVDMEPDHSAFFPGGLIADLEVLLGRRIHVVTEDALHPCIRESVLAEAVKL